MRRIGIAAVVAFVLLCRIRTQATAAPTPAPYQSDDATGFNAILPPGNNGFASLADRITFNQRRTLPANSDDALAPYTDLIFDYPSLTKGNLNDYFHDGSFGVKPENVKRTYSPRSDVTIIRGTSSVAPTSTARPVPARCSGPAMSAAEDRLFFMDALRHAGRGETCPASRAGPTPAWTSMSGTTAPYPSRPTRRSTTTRRPRLDEAEWDGQLRSRVGSIRRRHKQVHLGDRN